MKYVLATVFVLVVSGCATSPAPQDVRYIDTSQLASNKTRIDEDEERPVSKGLDNTIPDEGEYDLALWVINLSGEPAKFTLKLRDEKTTREIWRRESLPESIDLKNEPDGDGLSEATRMCVVRVKGDSATLIVNGEEHLIEPTGRARVDTWMVAIFADRVVIELFEMH